MGMLTAETLINWFKCTDQELNFEYNEDDELLKQLKEIIMGGSSTIDLPTMDAIKNSSNATELNGEPVKVESTILDSDDDGDEFIDNVISSICEKKSCSGDVTKNTC